MPCPSPSSPVRNRRTPVFGPGPWRGGLLMLLGILGMLAGAPRAAQAEQLWSVHAFGLKVGELRVSMAQEGGKYQGSSLFRTTGLAGIVRRIRFDIRAGGRHDQGRWQPQSYRGDIHTGRRQSRMTLDFSTPVPQASEGDDAPAVPIPDQALIGAVDPMTMTWLVLGQVRAEPCLLDQTQFDGTRLTAIRFESREERDGELVCRGVYDRLGGYSAEELREITRSPLSVTYRRAENGWQARRLDIRTRHGPATLHRRD